MVASELDRRSTGLPTNRSGQPGRCPPPVIVKVHLKKHLRDNPALAAVVEEAERTRLAQLHKKRKGNSPRLAETHQEKQGSSPRLVRLHQERQCSSPKLAQLQLERQTSSPMPHQEKQCSLLRLAWRQKRGSSPRFAWLHRKTQGSSPRLAWMHKERQDSSPKLAWRHEESQEARPRQQPSSANYSPHSLGKAYTHDSRSDSTRRQRLSPTSCPSAQNICNPSLSGTHSHQESCPVAGEEQHRRITSRRHWRELLQRAACAFRKVLMPLCRDKKVARSSDSLVDRF